jgi:hypothetical protein
MRGRASFGPASPAEPVQPGIDDAVVGNRRGRTETGVRLIERKTPILDASDEIL